MPSSITRESEDKREATRKLGYIARAATIFRVDRLSIFPDPEYNDRFGDGFVHTVLSYAVTPPYLRKELWDRRDELEYAGVLPPLLVHSQTGSGSNGSGSLRQGIVTEVGPDGRVRVNCGMQHPISLPASPGDYMEGERVNIRVSSRQPVRAKLVDEPVPGFVVENTTMEEALSRSDAGVRIAASRHGEPLTVDYLGHLVQQTVTGMTIAFGAPNRGLPDILDSEPTEETFEDEPNAAFDLWLNTIPNQGSEVVRTEEALFASLALLTLE